MFDHIDQPPQVPLYPAKRALHPRPHWTSYIVGRSPDSNPDHASSNGLPPPNVPPARTFKAQRGDPYALHSISDGGERRVSVNTPSQPYPGVGIPVNGCVEFRRSIYPYDHNGVGGWRASDVASTASNDAVDPRAELPPHRLSPGPHTRDLNLHQAGYRESQSESVQSGGASGRRAWSQQPRVEWNTGTGFSAAAAAAPAAPSATTRKGDKGPAWRGGGGIEWK